MTDSAEIVNTLAAKLLKNCQYLDDKSTSSYCFSPSSAYTSLCYLSSLLAKEQRTQLYTFLGTDVDELLECAEEKRQFSERLPKLVFKDQETELKCVTRLFLSSSEKGEPSIVNEQLASLFNVSTEVVSDSDYGCLLSRVKEWAQHELRCQSICCSPSMRVERDERSKLACMSSSIRFSGSWLYEFDLSKTSIRKFHSSFHGTDLVRTMYVRANLRVAVDETLNATVVELPFTNPSISAMMVLPKKDVSSLSSLLDSVNPMTLDDWISMFEPQEAEILVPKIKISLHNSLIKSLKKAAFHGETDDLGTVHGYRLADYTQATYLKVNEVGSSAKDMFSNRSARSTRAAKYIEPNGISRLYKFNRPFLFVVYDADSRCPLLVSSILHPMK